MAIANVSQKSTTNIVDVNTPVVLHKYLILIIADNS